MNPSTRSTPSPTPTSSGWRLARNLLLAAAAVATLIVAFYTVENWRGQRAWDQCRRTLEAKGEVLDWAAYIPAPVPDDQNFYQAPHIQPWFVKGPLAKLASLPAGGGGAFVPAPRKDADLLLAEVTVVAPNAALAVKHAGPVLRLDAPSAREQVAKLLQDSLGPCALGVRMDVLLAQPLEQIKPLHLVLQADATPSVKDLTGFFPRNPLTNSALAQSSITYLRVEPAGSKAFRVFLKAPVYGAADYLAWTAPLTSNFDLVRQALERPYARINCDYQQPFAITVPDFITIRTATQTLAERTRCYLLLGQPEAAWHELALVHDLCQILGPKPPGEPEILVSAMINGAVTGMYAGIVEDGLRLHAWREPQLLAIERQLQESDLLALTLRAFHEERAATLRTFEITARGELVKIIGSGDAGARLALTCMPRGWLYQNMVQGTQWAEQWLGGGVDVTNRLVHARRIAEAARQGSRELERPSPYNFLARIALPNFTKALQTTAYNQVLVDEAGVACALERYRLAQGQYPETLEALAPQYVKGLPHDLIGGQPLKYRRTEDGGYVLYSVGWNQKDDGGLIAKSREEGDWVWELR